LPKSIRQALGADTGSKLAFELRGAEVVVTRADADHEDPAIAAFLTLLARDKCRQGNTMGPVYRHWRRAKLGRRYRLLFRYDSKAKIIVYAWVNDEQTLGSSGSKSYPYAVFEKMLGRGNPPDEWSALVEASKPGWSPPD